MVRFWVLAALAMTALGPIAAQAQEAVLYTVTYVELGPKATRQGAALLKTYHDAGRKDDGNMRFDLLQRTDRKNQFTVIGAWKDQKAFDAHVASANAKQMNEKIGPLRAAPNDTRQHNGLAVASSKGGAKLYAVTHVDVIPPQKDNGVAAVKQLAEDSRKHAGNVSFDVLQQTNRPNHFTVVESWTDRPAFNTHVGLAQSREFRNKLSTMTGALYDERLYKTVD